MVDDGSGRVVLNWGGGLSGTKMDYAMDWPIVPKTWPLKIGITISREKVLVLEYAIFQLRKKRRHVCLVVGFHQLGHSPTLDYIFVCH